MAKAKRSVLFNHRNGTAGNGRRASVSEMSDGTSESGSLTKSGLNGKAAGSKEEVHISLCTYPAGSQLKGNWGFLLVKR